MIEKIFQVSASVKPSRLAVVFPCYREKQSINPAYIALKKILDDLVAKGNLYPDWILCFVDDGSDDDTWTTILELTKAHDQIRGLRLAHNVGQQGALLAGLGYLRNSYDVYITMDVDLQDNPIAIPQMLRAIANGYGIAYGVRSGRHSDSHFKRYSAGMYYKLLVLTGVTVIPHHADFRALNNEVLKVLLEHPYAHLFLRAVIPKLGFKGQNVPYARLPRKQGQTKYSLLKMVSLGIDGLTLSTSIPLKVILLIGLTSLLFSVSLFTWAISLRMHDVPIPDWLTTTTPFVFFGGLQCIALSLIGEYMRRIYLEKRSNPKYVIREVCGFLNSPPSALSRGRNLPLQF